MVLKISIPTILLLGALVGISGLWARHRQTATELRRQITALRLENDRLEPLRSERRRLQQLQRELEPRNATHQPPPEREALSPKQIKSDASFPSSLVVGEWSPHTVWRNRGRATPTATLETTLWAAAGGDLATLKNGLVLDDTVRAQAEAIRSKLPASSQSLYASPEELVAALATISTPLGDAQLVWQQQSDQNNAAMCVFLKSTETTNAPGATPMSNLVEKNPPPAPANSKTKTVYLNLHRSEECGWQLVVPKTALAKMMRGFVPPTAP